MATSQPGVFAQGTRTHRHLEFDLSADAGDGAVGGALADLWRDAWASAAFNAVVGVGPDLWRRLGPETPEGLTGFPEIPGVARTPHDIWVWLHGAGEDVMLDAARSAAAALAPVAALAAETAGFVYHDSRDLTGFVDGTENPPVAEAPDVALVPRGHPGAGGSFAMTQRWVHDLAAFDALPVPEQEAAIGRTKDASVELDDDTKAPTAHIARVVIEEDGEELEIYRRSIPYGTVSEAGLYFVAFSADPGRFEKMLRRMFGHSGDGLHDHLTDFTRPVSGSYYFVPSLEDLVALG